MSRADADADAPIEEKAVEYSKSYSNGDFVRIRCKSMDSGMCNLYVSVDGKRKSIELNFRELGILPSFDYVRMTGSGRPFFVSITLGYRCRKFEQDAIDQPIVGAFCRISFDIGGDYKVVWSGVEVIPNRESIYLELPIIGD